MSDIPALSREFSLGQYNEYLRLCVERPELSSWLVAKKTFDFDTPRRTWQMNIAETERYFWFLGYALHVFELVLHACPEYRAVLIKNLEWHSPVLTELWRDVWSDIHSATMNELVLEAIGISEDA